MKILARWLRKVAQDSSGGLQNEAAEAAIGDMKVEIAQLIGATLRARRLTQTFAAKILKIDQARISDLARGRVKGTSLDRLLRFLLLLGWDTGIVIAKRPMGRSGKIGITADGKAFL